MANTYGLKTFDVTFTTQNKLHPTTRTVRVDAVDEISASGAIMGQFGTMSLDKMSGMRFPSRKRIVVDSITEIVAKAEKSEKAEKDNLINKVKNGLKKAVGK